MASQENDLNKTNDLSSGRCNFDPVLVSDDKLDITSKNITQNNTMNEGKRSSRVRSSSGNNTQEIRQSGSQPPNALIPGKGLTGVSIKLHEKPRKDQVYSSLP